MVPIELNTGPINQFNGKNLTFLGYGIPQPFMNTQSGVLRKATLNVLRASACKFPVPLNFTDAFCAISPIDETPCFGKFLPRARHTVERSVSLSGRTYYLRD